MRIRRASFILFAALVALLTTIGTAAATVTFDPSTGTGFVGKGDVQLAFGWNNAQLQNNAIHVAFSYNATDTYSATCSFITGEGTPGEKTQTVDVPRHITVNDQVQYDARTHKQVDGFILTGFGDTSGGTTPVVGQPCVSDNGSGIAQNGTWSAVTLVSSTGGLYVNYGSSSYLLQ